MRRILLLAAVLAFPAAALGQQYKWIDEKGRTRYGDIPPPGVRATPLKPPPPAPSAPAAAKDKGPLSTAEKDAEFRKRQQEAEKAREKEALASQEAQAKKENCARAQEYVRTIESGQRISRTDSKGERYYLDDAERAQELSKARQAASQWCG